MKIAEDSLRQGVTTQVIVDWLAEREVMFGYDINRVGWAVFPNEDTIFEYRMTWA
ncbi:hypothetical protein ACFZ8E_07430 [Methylobacterium sp. HMF5984]|uniref:hypothetical protein n=1 Tax=Methylobacterium sp. HMF5984 TaxID=3367370 RepID=UPI0038548E30